jgi:ParB family chromosome partitioning protein
MDTVSLFEGAEIISGAEAQRLMALETTIERGLYTFVEVGNALLEIRDSRLYRTTHGTFEDYCRERWGMKRSYAYELIDAAGVVGNLSGIPDKPSAVSHARPLTRLEPEAQRIVWQQAVDTAPNGKVTAAHVQSVVERVYPLTAANHAVSASPDYDGDEWYTPAEYIEAARRVMVRIDLDPASSEAAQEVVQAGMYYTKETNGLDPARMWRGNIWMNPPYSMPAIRNFVDRLISEYVAGNVNQAVALTNNSSDTAWFHALLSRFPACIARGRVQFWRPGHDAFGARQGQTIFYLGANVERFATEFAEFGIVVRAI